MNEFFTTRKTDSRKKDEEKLVHKKTLAMVLTCVNHIYQSKAIPHPYAVQLECKNFIKGFANEVGTKRKNCDAYGRQKRVQFQRIHPIGSICSTRCIDRGMLIARSISVALLQYNRITWGGDCLVIKLGSVRWFESISISLFYSLLIFLCNFNFYSAQGRP